MNDQENRLHNLIEYLTINDYQNIRSHLLSCCTAGKDGNFSISDAYTPDAIAEKDGKTYYFEIETAASLKDQNNLFQLQELQKLFDHGNEIFCVIVPNVADIRLGEIMNMGGNFNVWFID